VWNTHHTAKAKHKTLFYIFFHCCIQRMILIIYIIYHHNIKSLRRTTEAELHLPICKACCEASFKLPTYGLKNSVVAAAQKRRCKKHKRIANEPNAKKDLEESSIGSEESRFSV